MNMRPFSLLLITLAMSPLSFGSEADLGFVTIDGDLPKSFQEKLNHSGSDDLKEAYALSLSDAGMDHHGDNGHYRLSIRHKKDSDDSISDEIISQAKSAFFKAAAEEKLLIERLYFFDNKMSKDFEVSHLKKEGEKEVDTGDFNNALTKALGKDFERDYEVSLERVGREVFHSEKKGDKKERVMSQLFSLTLHAKSEKKGIRPNIIFSLMNKIACVCSDFDLHPAMPPGEGMRAFGPESEGPFSGSRGPMMNGMGMGPHHNGHDFHHCKKSDMDRSSDREDDDQDEHHDKKSDKEKKRSKED